MNMYVVWASVGRYPVDRMDEPIAICDDKQKAIDIALDAVENLPRGEGEIVGVEVFEMPGMNTVVQAREIVIVIV